MHQFKDFSPNGMMGTSIERARALVEQLVPETVVTFCQKVIGYLGKYIPSMKAEKKSVHERLERLRDVEVESQPVLNNQANLETEETTQSSAKKQKIEGKTLTKRRAPPRDFETKVVKKPSQEGKTEINSVSLINLGDQSAQNVENHKWRPLRHMANLGSFCGKK